MPHNTDRILTTHVGSLIRPPKLIEFWRSIEDGKPYDEAAFEVCLTESVADVVRQQVAVGVDVVSDGEFSKGLNWAFYIFKRLKGIAVRPATPEELQDPMASMSGGQDRKAFPKFYAEYDAATSLGKRLSYRVVVNGQISYSGQNQVGPRHQEHHCRPRQGQAAILRARRIPASRGARKRAARRQNRTL